MELKEQAIKNLIDFKHIADRRRVNFFLFDGTLLGAIRDHDIIAGDEDDIDLAIVGPEYVNSIKAIEEDLANVGFRVIKTFDVHGFIEGLGIERGGNHIDLVRVNFKDGKAFNYGRGNGKLYAYVVNEEHFTRWDTVEIFGQVFKVPHKPTMFLEQRYVDWRTPTPRTQYNYLSKEHIPCLEVFEDTSGIKM